ncbi:uncharacterized protein LOC123028530 isoform X2 [Varanus komodoensis]|uniref:uncharacterized protein LOC123028530 isoform X2 n=1 Tax=Varanus komodoensis TaxID=61221 RepID=UPI001CF7769A|nr:uncharacterized protein LOC123028530 isoform X2 [Varanus komodoensis]XP_044296357.1 uncharacterized protein LOC123028530 isoform X2 [Varanus komodoensis]
MWGDLPDFAGLFLLMRNTLFSLLLPERGGPVRPWTEGTTWPVVALSSSWLETRRLKSVSRFEAVGRAAVSLEGSEREVSARHGAGYEAFRQAACGKEEDGKKRCEPRQEFCAPVRTPLPIRLVEAKKVGIASTSQTCFLRKVRLELELPHTRQAAFFWGGRVGKRFFQCLARSPFQGLLFLELLVASIPFMGGPEPSARLDSWRASLFMRWGPRWSFPATPGPLPLHGEAGAECQIRLMPASLFMRWGPRWSFPATPGQLPLHGEAGAECRIRLVAGQPVYEVGPTLEISSHARPASPSWGGRSRVPD